MVSLGMHWLYRKSKEKFVGVCFFKGMLLNRKTTERKSKVIRPILQVNGRKARKESMCAEGVCKEVSRRKYTVKLI